MKMRVPTSGVEKAIVRLVALCVVVLILMAPVSSVSALSALGQDQNWQIVRNGFLIAYGSYIPEPYNVSVTNSEVKVNGVVVAPIPQSDESQKPPVPYDLSLIVGNASANAKNWEILYGADEAANMTIKWLSANNVTATFGLPYHDVLVPIDNSWGVVVYLNELHRWVPPTQPTRGSINDMTPIYDSLVGDLEEGCLVIVDYGCEIILPPSNAASAVSSIKNALSSGQPQYDKVTSVSSLLSTSYDIAEKIMRNLKAEDLPTIPNSPAPASPPTSKTAVIFFAVRSWQQSNFGHFSTCPGNLATTLPQRGYTTQFYVDTAVTYAQWTTQLRAGRGIYYDLSQGGYILGPDGKTTNYIVAYDGSYITCWVVDSNKPTNGYPHSLVYIHACDSLMSVDYRLSSHWISDGAGAYCGWTLETSGDPTYCDSVDNAFWFTEMYTGKTVSQAISYLHAQGLVPDPYYGADFNYQGDGSLKI